MAFKRIKGMISESDPRVSQIGHPGPPWMISYADLMTEMVAFFIILYALGAALDPEAQRRGRDLEDAGKNVGMTVSTEVTKNGIMVTVQEEADKPIFESGQVSLSAQAVNLIDKMAPILKKHLQDIEVQGHTDNVPVGRSPFASNWELSTARATFVVRYLIDQHGLNPARIAAIGYGEHRPLVANDTPENRAKNRRVVFFLKTEILPEKEGKTEPEGVGSVTPAPPSSSEEHP